MTLKVSKTFRVCIIHLYDNHPDECHTQPVDSVILKDTNFKEW
jgi:hypothetical protein